MRSHNGETGVRKKFFKPFNFFHKQMFATRDMVGRFFTQAIYTFLSGANPIKYFFFCIERDLFGHLHIIYTE